MDEDIKKLIETLIARVGKLEEHIINLIVPIQHISHGNMYENLKNIMNSPIKIDDREIKESFIQFEHKMEMLKKILTATDFHELNLNLKQTNMADLYGMVKYQANRLKEIEKAILEMKFQQTKIKLNVSVDGKQYKETKEKSLAGNNIIDKLTEKEYKVFQIYMRDGVSTFRQVSKIMKISPSSVSAIWSRICSYCKNDKLLFDYLLSTLQEREAYYFSKIILDD